jgi:hypothetical protein
MPLIPGIVGRKKREEVTGIPAPHSLTIGLGGLNGFRSDACDRKSKIRFVRNRFTGIMIERPKAVGAERTELGDFRILNLVLMDYWNKPGDMSAISKNGEFLAIGDLIEQFFQS